MPSPAQPSTEGRLPRLIVVCGATATGKTDLSLELAERLPGVEIVSADSRQVYRGMDVGTAKASAADRRRVPHHGLDLVDPDQAFTAADYQRHATAALAGIGSRGGAALLVGGTGLYLRAVARGLPLEETGRDEGRRNVLEERLGTEGLPALAAELRDSAPNVATMTDMANPRRVIRALERVSATGDRPPPAPRGYPAPALWLGLRLEPDEHRRRIETRAATQFGAGLLDEAARLLERYPPTLPAFSALGYREAFGVIDGSLTVEEAVATTVARTVRFARRQRTWFRAEPDVTWLDAAGAPLAEALRRSDQLLEG